MNLREMYRARRAIADSLPAGNVFLVVPMDVPEKNVTAGDAVEVNRETAARLLFAKTHRLADAADVAAHEERESRTRNYMQEREYDRKQEFALPKELAGLVAAAVANSGKEKK